MFWIKFSGLAVLFACSCFSGILFAKGYRWELEQMQDYHRFLLQLKSEMENGRNELASAFMLCAQQRLQGTMQEYVLQAAKQLASYEGESLEEIWTRHFQDLKLASGIYLDNEDMLLFQELGSILSANHHYYGVAEQLELHIKNVEMRCDQLQETVPKNQKLATNLGVCIGGLIVILLC